VTGRRGRKRQQLLDDLKKPRMGTARVITRSHSLESWLWKRPRTCRKTTWWRDV